MKVVAFSGSARKGGNTALMLRRVLGVLEAEGIETELIELAGKKAQGCTVCLKCRETKDRRCHGRQDAINECIEKADKIIIGDIMLLIPGLAFTNAVKDIFIGDTISGVMRLIETILWAAALALGFALSGWLLGV